MNWRNAIGEVLLIVIGVSIALAANSWYEDRQKREEERAILAQIRQTLELDLVEFEGHQRAHLEQEAGIIKLLEHMEGDDAYSPELDFLGSLRRWRQTASNRAAFEALRSRGFELVQDAELRSKIINYYEELALRPAQGALNDRAFVVSRIGPYMDRNFVFEDSRTMVPIDYDSLRRDVYFRNLCITKLRRLQNFILPNYQRTNKMIRELIAAVDIESERWR
jgi:hypothetical protein